MAGRGSVGLECGWKWQSKAADSGHHAASNTDEQTGAKADGHHEFVNFDAESTHGELNGDAIKQQNGKYHCNERSSHGSDQALLQQASRHRLTRESKHLQHADLAHSAGKRGVHGVEATKECAQCNQHRTGKHHDAHWSVEGALRCVVIGFGNRAQFKINAPLCKVRHVCGGRICGKCDDHCGDCVALGKYQ